MKYEFVNDYLKKVPLSLYTKCNGDQDRARDNAVEGCEIVEQIWAGGCGNSELWDFPNVDRNSIEQFSIFYHGIFRTSNGEFPLHEEGIAIKIITDKFMHDKKISANPIAYIRKIR